jgi:ABC-type amino acid transport substrate-binding protein
MEHKYKNQPHNEDEHSNNKKTMNVFVMVSDGVSSTETYLSPVSTGYSEPHYIGYPIEVFRKVIDNKKIKDNYNFRYTYNTKELNLNYDEVVNKVSNGTYDIAIGTFSQTYEREMKLSFLQPIANNGISVITSFGDRLIDDLKSAIYISARPMLVLFAVGAFFGVMFYLINAPTAEMQLNKTKHRRHMAVSVMAGLLTSFGRRRYNVQQLKNQHWYSYIMICIQLLVGTITVMYAHAYITTKLITQTKDKKDFARFINTKKPILGINGYTEAEELKKMGGNVKFYKISTEKLMDKYIKNMDKYEGIVLGFIDGIPLVNRYRASHNIHAITGFNNSFAGFPINKNHQHFIDLFNESMLRFQKDGSGYKLCSSHLGTGHILEPCSAMNNKLVIF